MKRNPVRKTNKQVMFLPKQISNISKIAKKKAMKENRYVSFSEVIRDCVEFYLRNVNGLVAEDELNEAMKYVVQSVEVYAEKAITYNCGNNNE